MTLTVDVARCPACRATNVQGLRMRWAPEHGPLAFEGKCPHQGTRFVARFAVPGVAEGRAWLGARNLRWRTT